VRFSFALIVAIAALVVLVLVIWGIAALLTKKD